MQQWGEKVQKGIFYAHVHLLKIDLFTPMLKEISTMKNANIFHYLQTNEFL